MDGIISKSRVKKNGEVFTPDSIVNDMIDLADNQYENETDDHYIERTVLEPTCGNGAILVRILDRKLERVKNIKDNGDNWEEALLKAVASIYGVDITADNAIMSKRRMLNLIKNGTIEVLELDGVTVREFNGTKFEISDKVEKIIKEILDRNIQCGDTLKYEMHLIYDRGFDHWKISEDSINEENFYTHNSENSEIHTESLMLTQWLFEGTEYINRQCSFESYKNHMEHGTKLEYYNTKELKLYYKIEDDMLDDDEDF